MAAVVAETKDVVVITINSDKPMLVRTTDDVIITINSDERAESKSNNCLSKLSCYYSRFCNNYSNHISRLFDQIYTTGFNNNISSEGAQYLSFDMSLDDKVIYENLQYLLV